MHALGAINPQPCAFGKVILSRHCACSKVNKRYAAEREMIDCRVAAERERCGEVLDKLRQNSAFALKLAHITLPLPHGPEMRVQYGGLQGLQLLVDGSDVVADISVLITAALEKFDSIENFPYSKIVQSVASCEVRKKRPTGD